jgi:circadian clock protein KaiB
LAFASKQDRDPESDVRLGGRVNAMKQVGATRVVLGAENDEQWDLCVYVTGSSPRGLQAIENLRRFCEEHLAGRHQIEVVDVLKNPRRAAADQILAAPTVVRRLPAPIRKLVGDLSDSDRLLTGLEGP